MERSDYFWCPQRRKFDLEHPRFQLFSKTDLAKVEMTWRGRPELVSLGAQKNFAHFAHAIGKEWDKRDEVFSEEWFRNAISKLIVFRKTERIVSDAAGDWYTGGLRANTVCYAVAKLVHDIEGRKQSLDLKNIWNAQDLPEALTDVIDQYAEAVHMHLLSPPAGGSNPTEWAKKKPCADAAMKVELEFRSDISGFLIGSAERNERSSEGRRDQRMVDGIHAQVAVAELGSDEWAALRDWSRNSDMRLSPTEDGILEAATKLRLKPLSEAQSVKAIALLDRARQQGYSGKAG